MTKLNHSRALGLTRRERFRDSGAIRKLGSPGRLKNGYLPALGRARARPSPRREPAVAAPTYG
jgi:hypothetical protein